VNAKRLFSCLAAALLVASGGAFAAPDKPVRIVVPFPAGGASDAAARAVGQGLAKSLARPVIVENRPGANGAIAAQAVHAAPPDGNTLLWTAASMVALPALMKSPPFATLAEFTPVGGVGDLPFCLFVNPQVPARTVAELVAHARANPSKLNYGSGSLGEYLAAEQFAKLANLKIERVPYRGGSQLMPDLVAGRLQLNIGPASTGVPHVTSGRLRALAVLTRERSPMLPDVPTATQAGFAGFNVPAWQALLAPPKTPRAVAERLSKAVADALRDAETTSQFERIGMLRAGSTPDELEARIRQDHPLWAGFVREYGIEIE
jgi:tripartite-type tricarboxylate transporter receptor subunit TctC